jgi:low affinity Fe/Cu permease
MKRRRLSLLERPSRPAQNTAMHDVFRKFAKWCADTMGSAEVFLAAAALIVVWMALGPRYHYSDTWQLAINTATTIVTFLMVFVIQNTQNRDAKAIQLKLDELIRAVDGARTRLVRLEELSDDDLQRLTGDFEKLRNRELRNADAASSSGNPPD